MRSSSCLVLSVAILAGLLPGRTVRGQLLPPIGTGSVTAHLSAWADGLPTNLWVSNGGVDFWFGPTDVSPVPGSSQQVVVTTHVGQAFVVADDGQVQEAPFLDFLSQDSPTYSRYFEATPIQGLTALAFHPQFTDVGSPGYGRFYTLESENVAASPIVDFADSLVNANHHHEVVYEYTMSDHIGTVCDVSCSSTKRPLMRVDQPGLHHNLGDLIFGQDGLLYISSGDGNNTPDVEGVAISDNSQLLTNVFGKILRVDPLGSNSANGAYGIPADNPFVDGAGPQLEEIYAYGLRNPYRMALDASTGDLYTSETGQLNIESVYRIERGGNYGWNLLEGSFIYDASDQSTVLPDEDLDGNGIGDLADEHGFLGPVFEYDHQSGIAVIGSVLYRGQQFPELVGKFIFADHFGQLFYGDPATGEILAFQLTENSAEIPALVFGINQDAQGELFVIGVTQRSPEGDGVVYRLLPAPLIGDFDGDGRLDADDIELLTREVLLPSPGQEFDLNRDGRVDQDDRDVWVRDLKNTYFGDANLDGEFNSSDLVTVFEASEYEDDLPLNSVWSEGDWSGDLDFTTSDFVRAFEDAGYEQGPRAAGAVPEPTAAVLLGLAGICGLARRRHGRV